MATSTPALTTIIYGWSYETVCTMALDCQFNSEFWDIDAEQRKLVETELEHRTGHVKVETSSSRLIGLLKEYARQEGRRYVDKYGSRWQGVLQRQLSERIESYYKGKGLGVV